MRERKGLFLRLVVAVLAVSWLGMTGSGAQFSPAPSSEPLARVAVGWRTVQFLPKVTSESFILNVSQPDGTVFSRTFSGETPVYSLPAGAIDGSYTYELRASSVTSQRFGLGIREAKEFTFDAGREGAGGMGFPQRKGLVQSGSFQVSRGSIVLGGGVEPQGPISVMDVVHADDVVITGSLGVGFDIATDGSENFGFDTIRLKENNLRIHFDDTSTTAGFPANDWRIIVNDSGSGGANYFSVEDSTAASRVFTLKAGAPTNALYVNEYGNIGLGTSTPVLELHLLDSDTPSVRLDQDTSGGWTAQTWDVAGNESNFFIRDTTGGSKLPFRIQPGSPTNSITIKSDGAVGIGTWSPGWPMELERTGTNACIVVDRTDGAINYINATSTFGNFGTVNNYPLRLMVNGTWRMRLDYDNSLTMVNGATCTAGGVWTNGSSRKLKENIESLDSQEALSALEGLEPVKFNYKADKEEQYVGFIAEDVPELVATKDRQGMSPMDVVAVLTKVVQEQQATIKALQERVSQLEKKAQEEK